MNIHIRELSEEIYDKIKKTAHKEKRSINNQILIYLEQAVKADTMSAQDGTKKQ